MLRVSAFEQRYSEPTEATTARTVFPLRPLAFTFGSISRNSPGRDFRFASDRRECVSFSHLIVNVLFTVSASEERRHHQPLRQLNWIVCAILFLKCVLNYSVVAANKLLAIFGAPVKRVASEEHHPRAAKSGDENKSVNRSVVVFAPIDRQDGRRR